MKVRTKVQILSGVMVVVAAIMSLILFLLPESVEEAFQRLSDKDPSRLPDDPAVLKNLLGSLLELVSELEKSMLLMVSDLAWFGVFVIVISAIIFCLARRIEN